MRYFKPLLCCGLSLALLFPDAQAQNKKGGGLLKKIKQSAENVLNDVNNSGNTNNGNTADNTNAGDPASGSRNRPANRGGGGLVTTPPDVNENLTAAETSFKSMSYGEARYAIQQAMLGVELKIGQNILAALPKTLGTLEHVATADQVTSTGWGWAGLTIHREWSGGDKQMDFTISNNAAFMQAVNMYLTNTGYAQSTGGEQKWKQTKIKGYRAVIEYDESSGYKLSVPLGQTSLLMYQGVNYANEKEFMDAAALIDIDAIKASLGEK